MSTESFIYFGFSITGIILTYFSYKARRFGWFRFLFLILCIQGTRDLGISPLYAELILKDYSYGYFIHVQGMEAFNSLALIGLCYVSLGMGVWFIYSLVGWRLAKDINQDTKLSGVYYNNDEVLRKGYAYAAFIAIIGLWAHIMVFMFLMPEYSLLELASSRATFSSELNLTDFRYSYLRMLSDLLQIGSLAMIYLSKGRGGRYRLAIIFVLIQILIEVIFGGRARVIQGIILFALVNHLIHPIKFRQVLLYIAAVFFFVILIGYIRSEVSGIENLINYSFRSVAMQDFTRMDDTAYILDLFPGKIQFTGWFNFLGSAVRIIPTIALPNTNSLYGYLIERLYGGINPQMGIGGLNFSTAAELYSWGGYTTVIIFGIIYGSIFAYILFWTMRYRSNPLVIIFALILFVKAFFLGVTSRLPDTLGQIFSVFIPISMIAAAISSSRYKLHLYTVLGFDVLLFYVLNSARGSGATLLPKACILFSIPFIYFICIKIMKYSGGSHSLGTNCSMSDLGRPTNVVLKNER